MRSARAFAPISLRPRPCVESLEGRRLLTLTVQFDFSTDTNNFFDTPEKRAILQTAADVAVARYGDTLAAIEPFGGNSWTAIIDHPATGGNVEFPNLTIPANTLLVYAGGRQMTSLGIGGPGGFNSSGTTAWNDLVAARGQSNARGDNARDFGPYGGSITFDTDPSGGWHFGLDETQIAGKSDFYSVALHEMTHLLGFGTSDSWESRVSGSGSAGMFTGPAAVGEYDGVGNVPVSSDQAHWSSGTNDDGKEAAMDPDLTTGTRKILTALDLAGMDDVGWELPLSATLSSAASVTTAGATSTTFSVTYTHYTNIDAATLGSGDLMVTGPKNFNAPASLESVSGSGKSVTATYSIAAPGGTFDGTDSGTYSVMMMSQAVGDGFDNFAPAGSLGSFAVDIDAAPMASLAAQNVTQLGGASHSVAVTYSDPSGIDGSSIDASDITVTRASDSLALVVTSAVANGSGNDSPRVVTYTLAAPDGAWDATDNGTYNVSLVAQQIRDANGTFAEAAALGSFQVGVGAMDFSAGSNVTFTDASGDLVTVSLKGPGSGQVLFDDPANADASSIVLNSTTSASTVTITAAGAGTSIGGAAINGALRSFTAKTTDLAGDMTASGAVPKLQFRNASGSITLNGTPTGVTLTLAQARDLSITAASVIKSIKANEWLDTDDVSDVITTPTLSSLTVKGALQAGVSAGTIGKISATGALSGADIRTTGSIGSVTVGSAADSFIFAGVNADISTLPQSLADFANPAATIKSVTLKGKLAPFDNTRIAAPFVGRALLGLASIGPNTTPDPDGLAADRINSVSGSTTVNGPYKRTKAENPEDGFGLIDFFIRVL